MTEPSGRRRGPVGQTCPSGRHRRRRLIHGLSARSPSSSSLLGRLVDRPERWRFPLRTAGAAAGNGSATAQAPRRPGRWHSRIAGQPDAAWHLLFSLSRSDVPGVKADLDQIPRSGDRPGDRGGRRHRRPDGQGRPTIRDRLARRRG